MTREWKPGDVAMWDTSDSAREVVFFRLGGQEFDQPGWQTAQDGEGYPRGGELRPLVVIDPEDRAQVERLLAATLEVNFMDGFDTLQAALREFANPTPPKPDEPTGLGAVVEDAADQRWIRFDEDRDTCWFPGRGAGAALRYDEIAAVRVLSEGVTS